MTDLKALRHDVERGWGLPVTSYSDQDWLCRERAAIFDKSWYYIGMSQTIPAPGDVMLGHAGRIPVIVSRDQSGTLHAMANVCRHRGHPVCLKPGQHRVLSCPYHGWTYGLDGRLRGAPGSEDEADFDKAEFGLRKLSIDTWGPMIFVSADPDARPLIEHYPAFPDVAAQRDFNLDPDAYTYHRRYQATAKANWKIWYDNSLECFHCPHVHGSSFNDAYAVDAADYECLIEDRVVSYHFPPKPQRNANQLQVTWNKHLHLFPGFFVTQQDDIMLVHQMRVIDADTTHVYWDILAEKGADPARVKAWCKIWEDTLVEDKLAVEAVHANVNAQTFTANRYMNSREPVPQNINRWVLDALGAQTS
ncbi:aromatic ring-hydroxylating dioxygenase subunit alpha [uncultured Tateyamaria sp.]|uniref:aromatic ring-hydroxylating oxygenase subunit alpha n=1 Tax=uncultured Tateyamaria sp. TaxID=455651 RepID=UPI002612C9A0|nr:aromatic ring-hydroxylating dioxygenase subunit alpha [uncultured Tateyamaria sp.]